MSDVKKFTYDPDNGSWYDESGDCPDLDKPLVYASDHAAEVARLTAELDAGIEAAIAQERGK